MKTIVLDWAVEMIRQARSLVIGGFMGVGTLERAIA
jgi:hypothetical protein